jgi:antitoxin (DNA-binding transcriptional repressor) of toxin-antitoxin stability system
VTLRIDVSEVGDRIEEALASAERGEEVVLERDGRVVAELRPAPLERGGLRAFVELRSGRDVSDDFIDWFAQAIEEGRESMNKPFAPVDRWAESEGGEVA